MKKRRKSRKQKIVKPKVVKLHPAAPLHIVVPKSVTPIVVHHPEQGIVAVVPAPTKLVAPAPKKKNWWHYLFDAT